MLLNSMTSDYSYLQSFYVDFLNHQIALCGELALEEAVDLS